MNAEERKRAENAHFFMRKYIEVKDWGAFLIVMNQQLKRAEEKAISEYKEALKVLALLMLTVIVAALGVCLLIPYSISGWILDLLTDVGKTLFL